MIISKQWALVILNENIKAILIALFACSIAAIFELLCPVGPDSRFNGRLQNMAILSLNALGSLFIIPFLDIWRTLYIPNLDLLKLLPFYKKAGWELFDAVARTILYAFLWDFFHYWIHRAQHVFPVLWKFHRVHHSDTGMNASTTRRHSFVSGLIGYLLVAIPTVYICGASVMPVIGQYILFGGWGYFTHANFKISFGRIAWLITGPQLHRLHHAKTKEFYNNNYASLFPILDFLFGTLRLPRQNEWPETGIEGDTTPDTLFFMTFLPWVDKSKQLPSSNFKSK